MATSTETPPASAPKTGLIRSEDWLAVILGGILLAVCLGASVFNRASDFDERLTSIRRGRQELEQIRSTSSGTEEAKQEIKVQEDKLKKLTDGLYKNPLKPYLGELGSWESNPVDAFYVVDSKLADSSKKAKQNEGAQEPAPTQYRSLLTGVIGVFVVSIILFAFGIALQGHSIGSFIGPFIVVFVLAMLSYLLAGQQSIKYYNLEYPLWALLVGMVISNTVGTPKFLAPAIRTELYIKTGLVLLGAEILLSRLLNLGLPGIFVSWVVTPITLITTYLFGQYVLRIPSKSLNMVISADMSVCGVSAAIATAAACRAKKEELSLAIGISLAFTAIMMVIMPVFIKAVGMSDVLAGAWLGGTIDSTGAVAAAGGMLGPTALQVAVMVKMIQNILIGVVAFGVAVYWVVFVERDANGPRPSVMEIWYRFPRFVFGFIGASIIFSMIYSSGPDGSALAEAVTGVTGKILRGWFFCLAFVAIGLETNFRELSHYLKDGKAITLYVCGQSLNLALTLFMAWIMFVKVFPDAAALLK